MRLGSGSAARSILKYCLLNAPRRVLQAANSNSKCQPVGEPRERSAMQLPHMAQARRPLAEGSRQSTAPLGRQLHDLPAGKHPAEIATEVGFDTRKAPFTPMIAIGGLSRHEHRVSHADGLATLVAAVIPIPPGGEARPVGFVPNPGVFASSPNDVISPVLGVVPNTLDAISIALSVIPIDLGAISIAFEMVSPYLAAIATGLAIFSRGFEMTPRAIGIVSTGLEIVSLAFGIAGTYGLIPPRGIEMGPRGIGIVAHACKTSGLPHPIPTVSTTSPPCHRAMIPPLSRASEPTGDTPWKAGITGGGTDFPQSRAYVSPAHAPTAASLTGLCLLPAVDMCFLPFRVGDSR